MMPKTGEFTPEYKARLKEVMKWKAYFSYRDVSNRLKALGIKRGASIQTAKKVLQHRNHANDRVLKAAEDVVNAQKLLLSGSPIPVIQFSQKMEQAA